MKAIFKKEFRGLLLNPLGIAVLVIYAVVSGIIFTYFNMVYGYSSVEIVFSFLAILVLALIPLISCTAFTSEKSKKTNCFLETLPLRKSEILMGKYFARLVFLAMPKAVMLLYPFALDIFGEVNYISCLSGLLALFLYEGFLLAFGIMTSALFSKGLWAYITTYITFIMTFLFPFLLTLITGLPEKLDTVISGIFMFLSPYGQFDSFTTGIFDLRKIIWFVAFSFIALAIAWLGLKKEEK